MVRQLLALASGVLMPTLVLAAPPKPSIAPATVEATVAKIVRDHPGADARARQGVSQVAERWFAKDGDDAAFTTFCTENFATDDAARNAIFARLQTVLEQIDGRLHEIRRMLVT